MAFFHLHAALLRTYGLGLSAPQKNLRQILCADEERDPLILHLQVNFVKAKNTC